MKLPLAAICKVPTPASVAVEPAVYVLPPTSNRVTVSAELSASLSLASTLPVRVTSSTASAASLTATGLSFRPPT